MCGGQLLVFIVVFVVVLTILFRNQTLDRMNEIGEERMEQRDRKEKERETLSVFACVWTKIFKLSCFDHKREWISDNHLSCMTDKPTAYVVRYGDLLVHSEYIACSKVTIDTIRKYLCCVYFVPMVSQFRNKNENKRMKNFDGAISGHEQEHVFCFEWLRHLRKACWRHLLNR